MSTLSNKVLDLGKKSWQNWGMGGQSIVGPLLRDTVMCIILWSCKKGPMGSILLPWAQTGGGPTFQLSILCTTKCSKQCKKVVGTLSKTSAGNQGKTRGWADYPY